MGFYQEDIEEQPLLHSDGFHLLMGKATIYQGNALDILRALPTASHHCVVTSPPYYGLRDYGVERQIGLEGSPEEYVASLVELFREVRRVLHDSGVVWLNLGDCYAGQTGYSGAYPSTQLRGELVNMGITRAGKFRFSREMLNDKAHPRRVIPGKPKDLVGIPWMVAFALRDDGWYLRSEVIWTKANPMPESANDRPGNAHEQIFMLSKKPHYFYDKAAVSHEETGNHNLRDVWPLNAEPYPEAHFATFPIDLPIRCIKAGTSEKGCCERCGAPYTRDMVMLGKKQSGHALGEGHTRIPDRPDLDVARVHKNVSKQVGWQPSCSCRDAECVPCRVLDPFAGSGTTGLAASQLSRNSTLIDLSPKYVQMAYKRITEKCDKPSAEIMLHRRRRSLP
jgi:DNA modification methylase